MERRRFPLRPLDWDQRFSRDGQPRPTDQNPLSIDERIIRSGSEKFFTL